MMPSLAISGRRRITWRMIEVHLAISHVEDDHLLVVPVDPRVIVVLEDGQPGDGPDDGGGEEDGAEGFVESRPDCYRRLKHTTGS